MLQVVRRGSGIQMIEEVRRLKVGREREKESSVVPGYDVGAGGSWLGRRVLGDSSLGQRKLGSSRLTHWELGIPRLRRLELGATVWNGGSSSVPGSNGGRLAAPV